VITSYYGHGSWLFLIVLFAFFAMRVLPSRRRRQRGQPRVAAPASPFTDAADTASRNRSSDAVDGSSGKVTFTGIAPGWLIDPSGRHEHRYWSGSEWTEHVTDGGVPGIDPPPNTGRERSS
jgi:hypothetical protein